MSDYLAPLKDMQFVLRHIAGLDEILNLRQYEGFDQELIEAVLDESAKFTSEVLAPLNSVGDRTGSVCENGEVTTPPGWKEAYRQFVDGGWNGLAFDPQFGGQGLPWLVATSIQEMWHSANMSFGLCPLLTQGAIRALESHGTSRQQQLYMGKLISGKWAGTMNLTEAHAGTDLAVIRTKAAANGDHYLISGQKIFITYGDHDLTENIIHFVLARCTDSPEGVKGISLFIVPKFLLNEDGSPGERNDIRCVSLEHKLGIHASPTAVLSYGDEGGAIGYLVGEKNRGLEYMFTMMNLARHAVGVEGLAIAERAYQQALEYAKGRVQGSAGGTRERVAIVRHPDVRRMLMTMKSLTEAMRCLAYFTSSVFDLSHAHPDEEKRKQYAQDLGLLIPIVKGWCAEAGNEVAYLGVQVHGGMGFIEETGAAQYLRDVRITPIYEGTTGIQANDLIGRKLLKDKDRGIYKLIDSIAQSCQAQSEQSAEVTMIQQSVAKSVKLLRKSTDWIYDAGELNGEITAASVAYMHLLALTVAGGLMAQCATRAAELADDSTVDRQFMEAKIVTAKFFTAHIMPRTMTYAQSVMNSQIATMELSDEQL